MAVPGDVTQLKIEGVWDKGKNDPTVRYLINAISHMKAYRIMLDEAAAIDVLAEPELEKLGTNMSQYWESLVEAIFQFNIKVVQPRSTPPDAGEMRRLKEERQNLLARLALFKRNLETIVDDIEIGDVKGKCIQEMRKEEKEGLGF